MSDVFNVLEKQPPLGEGNKVMTGRGMRCLSDGHFCWDDASGDDYENDIQESFFWSYDTHLKEQCLTAHKDFIINSAKVICVMILYFISIFICAIIKKMYDIDIAKTIVGGFFGFSWYSWYLSTREQEKEEEEVK